MGYYASFTGTLIPRDGKTKAEIERTLDEMFEDYYKNKDDAGVLTYEVSGNGKYHEYREEDYNDLAKVFDGQVNFLGEDDAIWFLFLKDGKVKEFTLLPTPEETAEMEKLVIEMPKDRYNAIINMYGTFPVEWKKWGLEAIKNGIQLPKKHRVYGLTIVPSGDNQLAEKDDEPFTKLFANEDERFEYALTQMKDLFASFEDGTDQIGLLRSDAQLDLWRGDGACIRGASEHYIFEFFEQEVEV